MSATGHTPINTQIYSEASEWLIEFRSGDIDAVGRRAFYNWLRTSPEHMRAYLELAAIWNEGPGLDCARSHDADSLMREIQADAKIIAIGTDNRPREERAPAGRPSRTALRVTLATAATVLLVVAVTTGSLLARRDTYTTGTGEQRTLALTDGTRIELNANSKIRVRYTGAARNVELMRGQALFHVAHETARPFIVATDTTRIRAVGTRFDVYRKTSSTIVTVVEGKVAVGGMAESSSAPQSSTSTSSASRQSQPTAPGGALPARSGETLLIAGEQAIVTAENTVRRAASEATTRAATAWTEGRLVFQGTPLREVAEEFNRYNTRPLVIRDPRLATLKITGIFSSTDPTSLTRFLEARRDVAVTQTPDEIRITSKTGD